MLKSKTFQRRATKTRFYCWTHWFWITCIIITPTFSFPSSSFETISTSLKSSTSIKTSALIQNENSFQEPLIEQNKFEQIKQNSMTLVEAEADSVFDGGGMNKSLVESNVSSGGKINDKELEKSSSKSNLTSVKLNNIEDVSSGLSVITLNNNLVNSTNTTSIKNTTVLNSITESLR